MPTARRCCFLGNSHIFNHAVAYQMRSLVCAASGPGALAIEVHTSGGRGLDWHRSEPNSVQAVQLNRWDDLVLQHLAHPWPGVAPLDESVGWWANTARASVHRIWLLMVWPELARPEQADLRAAGYRSVASTHGLSVVPIGDAWMAVRSRHPDLALYDSDGEHASVLGAYLAACTAAAAICGIDPVGLPARIEVQGQVLVDADPSAAAILQAAAATAAASSPR
jgi:hypothetical protein